VKDPATFLHSLGQALSSMALYSEGHPSLERAVEAAHHALDELTSAGERPSFTFLDGEVVYGQDTLRDFKDWDWGARLSGAGIERLEVERMVSRDQFDGFLQEIFARVMPGASTTGENRQMRSLGIRFGAVGVQGQLPDVPLEPALATLGTTLSEEVETLRWLQQQVESQGTIPLMEAEAVVRSLSVAMHADQRTVLPMLQLKEFDQYTTTHSLNVSVLSMALAETIGCRKHEVRALGVAGLMHDIGKICIPIEVLTKPGKLTAEERKLVSLHPSEGARMIMSSDTGLDLAAVVAFEHHKMLDGSGYPQTHYGRDTALASRLVHVCDVFDALRTRRPYREAWEQEVVFRYLLERSGSEFDPALVKSFVDMMRRCATHFTALADTTPAATPTTEATLIAAGTGPRK
jgi:putative nucleotidyltransferase with HDIG domain